MTVEYKPSESQHHNSNLHLTRLWALRIPLTLAHTHAFFPPENTIHLTTHQTSPGPLHSPQASLIHTAQLLPVCHLTA